MHPLASTEALDRLAQQTFDMHARQRRLVAAALTCANNNEDVPAHILEDLERLDRQLTAIMTIARVAMEPGLAENSE